METQIEKDPTELSTTKYLSSILSSGQFKITDPFLAAHLDRIDSLADYKSLFHIPSFPLPENKQINHTDLSVTPSSVLYFLGNSLGLKPKTANKATNKILDLWENYALLGFFPQYVKHSVVDYGKRVSAKMAKIFHVDPIQVAICNTLTINLNLLLVALYKPNESRNKILIMEDCFPSDYYAASQILRINKFSDDSHLVKVKRTGHNAPYTLDDILKAIEENKDQISIAIISSIHFRTAQRMDIKKCTEICHANGIKIIVDLAHQTGVVPIHFDDWKADAAVFCTYKYLNGGYSSIGGLVLSQQLCKAGEIKSQLGGWWGQKDDIRFQMEHNYIPNPGARGLQISAPNPVLLSMLENSLEIVLSADVNRIRAKSLLLTEYLYRLLKHYCPNIVVVTPLETRGGHLALQFPGLDAQAINETLRSKGVICDMRPGGTMRVSPSALYTSFSDVLRFVDIFVAATK